VPTDPGTPGLSRPTCVGITSETAGERLSYLGANVLPEARLTRWPRVLRQLQNPIIYILLFALAFNIIIVASVALQLLTLTIPGLRTMLGLVPLDRFVLGLVAVSLGITVIGEEIWSHRAIRNKATP
jgi:magnesium-transporting ATPase (P-type)